MSGMVYIGIGSNLGDRFHHYQQAVNLLREKFSSIITSPLYETDPLPGTEGGMFLNGVVAFETDLGPEELLKILKAIEDRLGRVKTGHWGERTIDLDILLFGDRIIQTEDLVIPHPELQNRRFVLKPLADVAAPLVHPVLGKTVQQLLDGCKDRGKVRLYEDFH